MILVGEGANGKTVVVTVLREMLGTGNHSGVGLEAFNPVRTFPLAATIGKLANIVGEISEMDRAAEGTIKMFVSGERMTIERKHKDAFEVTPTARLTFATNILPRFTDRSDGIWRRLLLIPFNGQILDPGRQDRRLISPEFWRTSGELAGVFNWAVTGLRRLQQRGHFIEPVVCSVAKGAYKLDSNPAGQFLVETCAARTGFSVATNLLHADYKKWVEERGCKPLSAGQFAKEVKRAFPNVSLSNPLAQPSGARSRAWIGIVSNQ
jgi:P4 family phage/plasmid primase-like protien